MVVHMSLTSITFKYYNLNPKFDTNHIYSVPENSKNSFTSDGQLAFGTL